MTAEIITEIEALLGKLKTALAPAVQAVETDVKEVGSSALAYIKANGLTDLYQLALGALTAAVPGASWTATLASIEAQAVADGKQLVSGATAVVAAQAQADLIAAGKLLPPTAS
jgi:hypothetical protein